VKLPEKPRSTAKLMKELMADPDRLVRVMGHGPVSATVEGRYVHWDRLKRRTPPKGLTAEEWWTRIKFARGAMTSALPLQDKSGRHFVLASPAVLQRQLHEADRDLSGRVEMPSQLTTPGVRDRYQMSALIEEAITSSQLEGAATTRKVANEMLRSGRQPRNKDERMIFNNFVAMEYVRSIRKEALTPELVFRIHRLVAEGTLPEPAAAGRLRTAEESGNNWGVYSSDGTLVHLPPPAEQLPQRLASCCAFANDTSDDDFVHPIIRSILLHFWIGYDHPFIDGNGRTARALFYWSMLHHDYWLAEYLSVSHILHAAPIQYTESYLFTETDDNDATYFVLYQMDVLLRSIAALLKYVGEKATAHRKTQEMMRQSDLNYRQVALLGHALRHPEAEYSVTRHANSHRVTRQTARTDLHELAGLGLLLEARRGNGFYFTVPTELDDRLEGMNRRRAARPGRKRGPGRPPRASNQSPLFKV
jgi:Fic family protein